MIYDRALTVCRTAPGLPPTEANLTKIRDHLYAQKTIFSKRFYESVEAGHRIDLMVELPSWWEYRGTEYVKVQGALYTLTQAELRRSDDGQPVTWLSLSLYARAWADELTLIGAPARDASGHLDEEQLPERRTVTCSIVSGIDGTETTAGKKSTLRLKSSVEVYSSDYSGERRAEFRGGSYEIKSAVRTERFTVRLDMEEVMQ